jgi:hypothetical protein
VLYPYRTTQRALEHVPPFVQAAAPPQVHRLFVHPSEVVEEHELAQVTVWPQLLVALPHCRPLQGALGAQHWFGPAPPTPHGVVDPQVSGHVMAVPQLLVAGPHAFPVHVTAGGSAVHPHPLGPAPAPPHVAGDVHVSGQTTLCPQLLVAGPHALPWHAVVSDSGTHPHAPLVHVRPPSQPPHGTFWPQLSVEAPQRFWHHVEGGTGVQHVWLDVQTPPSGHPPEQPSTPASRCPSGPAPSEASWPAESWPASNTGTVTSPSPASTAKVPCWIPPSQLQAAMGAKASAATYAPRRRTRMRPAPSLVRQRAMRATIPVGCQ